MEIQQITNSDDSEQAAGFAIFMLRQATDFQKDTTADELKTYTATGRNKEELGRKLIFEVVKELPIGEHNLKFYVEDSAKIDKLVFAGQELIQLTIKGIWR